MTKKIGVAISKWIGDGEPKKIGAVAFEDELQNYKKLISEDYEGDCSLTERYAFLETCKKFGFDKETRFEFWRHRKDASEFRRFSSTDFILRKYIAFYSNPFEENGKKTIYRFDIYVEDPCVQLRF